MATLAKIDNSVQLALRNIVGSPLSQSTRVDIYNRVIDYLQSKANWNCTKRIGTFDYLNNEIDYSIENNLSISDFKQPWDIRFLNDNLTSHTSEFQEIDSKKFSVYEGQNSKINVYNIEDRDNDKILRILTNLGRGDQIVHDMDDLDVNGTWASDTASSDATTLTEDTSKVKKGSASFKFNIDVSQSTNNYARIYTSTVLTNEVDAEDYEGTGSLRFWLGLHSLTSAQLGYITSVEFKWGTDSSNYWSNTATTTITGGDFKATWNRLNF